MPPMPTWTPPAPALTDTEVDADTGAVEPTGATVAPTLAGPAVTCAPTPPELAVTLAPAGAPPVAGGVGATTVTPVEVPVAIVTPAPEDVP